ncbi:hypothetical protein Tco_0830278 [Tanacetum coccineum]
MADDPKVIQQKAKTTVPFAELAKEVVDTVIPPKVDFATDLFDILTASSADDLWAGFQSAGEVAVTGTTRVRIPVDNNKAPMCT